MAPTRGPKGLSAGSVGRRSTSLKRVAGELDTDRERRTARGVASGSLKGRRLRDLCSIGGVQGGELGGSESWLEDDAMAVVPFGAGGQEKRLEAEDVSNVNLKV